VKVTRCLIACLVVVSLPWAIEAQSAPGSAPLQVPPAAGPPSPFFVRNLTRVETWHFFEPVPGGGDPSYNTVANRFQIGVRRSRPGYDVNASLQYVQFGNLPERAVGPGPLGAGALYFVHSNDTTAEQVYLKSLNVVLKSPPSGLTIQAGRLPYTSGAEAPSGQPKIEAVKRQRVDSRLIGEFEWAIFQRAYDGVRVDIDRSGFEDAAGAPMTDVRVASATLNARPGRLLPKTDVQLLAYYYADDRDVTQRPDNTGLGAVRADIGIATFGATVTSALPHTSGEVDVLIWGVGQTGRWYGTDHRAYSVAVEAGHQWNRSRWRPWVRGGALRASGDEDPSDRRHGTFFQMLPTVRRYSFSTAYSQMNLIDSFVQAILRPRPPLGLRIDVHRVSLAEPADRWYAGSGATQNRGSIFGYVPRLSQGGATLGTVVEGSADYTVSPHWSVNGYIGHIKGGDVIRRSFSGTTLTFAYVENVLQF
jgi:hypothetical protein